MKAVNPCGLKRAALINDLSCFGKCSLSVSMPILSSYGIETVPLPTALLSTHTGGFTGYVVQDTTEAMRAFAAHWKQVGVQFDCIATGYCCSPEQIRLAAEFIRSFADGRTLVWSTQCWATTEGSIAALPTRMSTPCGSCAVWRT